ncbi:MAG TPA: adenine nucleotide alpha hydrolase [Thermodesulfobacteriota bacterium]|nr:adenine nucleotide alpha hydrolase [Thermodesulfobacteriota bacterium]
MKTKALLSWSGGKDCAAALAGVLAEGRLDVAALVTTVTAGYGRISMHGVRTVLLQGQARALGIPLEEIVIPRAASNEAYEAALEGVLLRYRGAIPTVVYGDIFLRDVREYRERHLRRLEFECEFPLWGMDTGKLAREFIESGWRAVVVCVDGEALGGEFAGREYDRDFLTDLPDDVDPCGENGEFHTFVYDGPIFGRSVEFERGEVVKRDGRFYFCDLLPAPAK